MAVSWRKNGIFRQLVIGSYLHITKDHLKYIQKADNYGLKVEKAKINFDDVIKRSRKVANDMSKGVDFLMKKNKIDVIVGTGKVKPGKKVAITDDKGKTTEYATQHIIIASG